jgi:Dyp-type peroxidase family
MTVNLDESRIDHLDPKYTTLLRGLQANILKPHGRDYADHIFLRFTAKQAQATQWVQNFARNEVTTADQQIAEARSYRYEGSSGDPIVCFFLSAAGYRMLGFEPRRFKDEEKTFSRGMKNHGLDLISLVLPNWDTQPKEWEEAYQDEVHAMILLADDTPEKLKTQTARVCKSVASVATVLVTEHGRTRRNKDPQTHGKGKPIEHFGYVDGRSNPIFLGDEFSREVRDKGGVDRWDPSAPLKQVLRADPFADQEDGFGSFLVFRKLEQDVVGFNGAVRDLSSQLGVNQDLAGAMAVGRFKDGTPIALRPEDGLGDLNNFEYEANDRRANKCPFHAHVRKTNPRGGTPFTSEEDERARRITRRGISYGVARDDMNGVSGIDTDRDDKLGLLFMCYQADIKRQFEFVMRAWVDDSLFPAPLRSIPGSGIGIRGVNKLISAASIRISPLSFLAPVFKSLIFAVGRVTSPVNSGDDPIIGQVDGSTQRWRTKWGMVGAEKKTVDFGNWVTLRGGEYFFAPSLNFLKAIATR